MKSSYIVKVIGIEDSLLLVFRSYLNGWQFRVVTSDGNVLGENKIYFTASAAEQAGRDRIT